MIDSASTRHRHLAVALLATALYALLAAFFSYKATGGAKVFAFCMAPYLASAWVLIFTAPASGRAGFATGATAMLALFGTLIISSTDPKAGQLWWFHFFSVPVAAVGAGLGAAFASRWLRPTCRLAASAGAAILAGLLPYSCVAVFG